MDNRPEPDNFTNRIKRVIKNIPAGRVATYGQIASLAGHPGLTRRVVWILHSCSPRDRLPWHRVINARGAISPKPGAGYERQKALLESESVVFDRQDRIDLDRFLWDPRPIDFPFV